MTPASIVAFLAALANLFFPNNKAVQTTVAYITGLIPVIEAIDTGTATTVPSFDVGNVVVGPIPIAPKS